MLPFLAAILKLGYYKKQELKHNTKKYNKVFTLAIKES